MSFWNVIRNKRTACMDSHYGCSMRPKLLKKNSSYLAGEIKEKCTKYPVLVYRGMSGVATAIAISQHFDSDYFHGMIYVRKLEEVSHGSQVEHTNIRDLNNSQYIFCDDFISSGMTLYETLAAIQKNFLVKIKKEQVLLALSDFVNLIPISVDFYNLEYVFEKLERQYNEITEEISSSRAKVEEKLKEWSSVTFKE